jgi:hypothetical protein
MLFNEQQFAIPITYREIQVFYGINKVIFIYLLINFLIIFMNKIF